MFAANSNLNAKSIIDTTVFSVYGCLESNDAENDQGNGLTAFDEEEDAVRVQEITHVLQGKTP